MRILGTLVLLLAMLGWSTWFVICNVYEFAPAMNPWALAFGWLLALLGWTQAWRSRNRARWGWGLCGLAGCVGAYLLLIHRGVSDGMALAALVIASAGVLLWARKAMRRRG
ncbi:hypothetical protein [Stenotrophomonas sp. Iso1]|uniref:hypothetical protein n=1 Tax=Stenotrophomonas sp. Iso1 TaxID=2977283 RepID=UPI0022B7D610|nr:hypothetical protein [Stenotrophomonas sp. Iso1]